MSGPARYRIRVRGSLSTEWAERLGGMSCSNASGAGGEPETHLEGCLQDQAALSGVLNALYELHLPVLLVEHLEAEPADDPLLRVSKRSRISSLRLSTPERHESKETGIP